MENWFYDGPYKIEGPNEWEGVGYTSPRLDRGHTHSTGATHGWCEPFTYCDEPPIVGPCSGCFADYSYSADGGGCGTLISYIGAAPNAVTTFAPGPAWQSLSHPYTWYMRYDGYYTCGVWNPYSQTCSGSLDDYPCYHCEAPEIQGLFQYPRVAVIGQVEGQCGGTADATIRPMGAVTGSRCFPWSVGATCRDIDDGTGCRCYVSFVADAYKGFWQQQPPPNTANLPLYHQGDGLPTDVGCPGSSSVGAANCLSFLIPLEDITGSSHACTGGICG